VPVLTDIKSPASPASDGKLPIELTTGHSPLHSSSSIEPSTGLSSWSEVSPSNSSWGTHDDELDVKSANRPSSMASTSTGVVSSGQPLASETQASYDQVLFCTRAFAVIPVVVSVH